MYKKGALMDSEQIVDRLRGLYSREYMNLCSFIDLSELPLDIYIVVFNSQDLTPLGNKLGHGTPSYKQDCIILPHIHDALPSMSIEDVAFPPVVWTKNDSRFEVVWPEWRLTVWHETCHQLEHKLTGVFHGGAEHGESWKRALLLLSSHFDTNSSFEEFYDLLTI